VSGLTDEELMDAARSLERSRSLLDIFEGHVVAELEFRGSTLIDSGTRTSSFLADAGGRAKAECRQRVRQAVSLRSHFDVLDDAVAAGSISSAHAQAVVAASNPRILDQLKDLQPELIELAGTTTFDRWKRHLLELCSLLDQDGGYDPAADPCANKLTVRETGDGVALKGQLFGEAAEVARSAIAKLADELHRQFAADRDHVGPGALRPRRDSLNALALVELCRRAMGVSVDSSVPPRTQTDLIVHADVDGCQITHTADGGLLHRSAADALRCDEAIRAIVLDRHGNPIHVGREQRLATPAQRAAVKARDGGCLFPGCDSPSSWTIIHHVKPWAQGGRTDLENLVCLCHHHHGTTHSSGWTMEHVGDQHYQWTTPTRRTIRGERKHL
jgi:hypothetical protein